MGPGGELPALLAMHGRAAVDQLERDCPEAVPFAEITGDLCMERLRISAPMRAAYRRSLGVGPEQKLIVVSSTWGPYSLTGTDRSLPERLLADLPADEFKVAYIPHPNIDADHGGTLIPYMRPKLQNGLIMVPPEEGWRAALIASDCVVGDSGSVSLYASNLGRPVMLAAFAFEEMSPETPQERFGRTAPRLEREADPAPRYDPFWRPASNATASSTMPGANRPPARPNRSSRGSTACSTSHRPRPNPSCCRSRCRYRSASP
ncbi:hypothetical protein GCM10029992_67080 [Glycomyces albus]